MATDCLHATRELEGLKPSYAAVTQEIKATSRVFDEAIFRHESSGANKGAHRLARSSITMSYWAPYFGCKST